MERAKCEIFAGAVFGLVWNGLTVNPQNIENSNSLVAF